MDLNAKKALVRRYYDELWSQGKLSFIEQYMLETYENHDPVTPGGVLRGREGLRGLVLAYREAMPDLEMKVVEQHGEGDVIVSRWLATATQRGAMLGVPPTGRRLEGVEGITVTYFDGERIARDCAIWDALGMLRRLGVELLPPGARAAEDNKALVRRTVEQIWNAKSLQKLDELIAADYVGHFAVLPAPLAGRDAFKQFASSYFAAFPDIVFTIDDLVAEADRVVLRWTAKGTHQGPLMGHPASGKSVTVGGVWTHRVAQGRIAEQWGVNDTLSMLRQIGALPAR